MAKTNYPAAYSQNATTMVDRLNIWIYIRRYVKLAGRRWPLLVAGAVLGLVTSGYKAYTKSDEYLAHSTLTIEEKLETTADQDTADVKEVDFVQKQLTLLNSVTLANNTQERLKSPAVQAEVLDQYGLADLPGQSLSTRATNPVTTEFHLEVYATESAFAKLYAKYWAQEFLEYRQMLLDQTVQSKEKKVHAEILAEQRQKDAAKSALDEFREKHRIATPEDAKDFLTNEYKRLQAELDATTRRIRLLEDTDETQIAKGAILRDQLSDATSNPPKPPIEEGDAESNDQALGYEDFNDGSTYRLIEKSLLPFKREFDELKTVLKPAHPHYQYLKNEIDLREAQMSNELQFIRNNREALLANLKRDRDRLTKLTEEKNEEIFQQQIVWDEYQQLNSMVRNIDSRIDNLNTSLSELDRTEAAAEIKIIDEGIGGQAVFTDIDRHKMVLMGFIMGLGLGIAVAYLLHQLDDRLELAADIEEALNEPVLGQVPMVMEDDMPDEKILLITKLNQHNTFAEAIRSVRSAVMLGVEGGPKQLLLVSSAVPGDGKTTFTCNFAATLAIAGHRVLLIDADLRRGNVHNYFGQPREDGLADVLQGDKHWTDVLKQSEIPALQTITTGELPINPGELLISPVTQQFIAEIKQDYDFVIIDCPPLTAIDDTFALASSADGLLFVVRSGQTSMRFARGALDAVRQRGARILGVVVNGVTADNPYYYYSNYYHYYYTTTEKEGQRFETSPKQATRMAAPKSNIKKRFQEIGRFDEGDIGLDQSPSEPRTSTLKSDIQSIEKEDASHRTPEASAKSSTEQPQPPDAESEYSFFAELDEDEDTAFEASLSNPDEEPSFRATAAEASYKNDEGEIEPKADPTVEEAVEQVFGSLEPAPVGDSKSDLEPEKTSHLFDDESSPDGDPNRPQSQDGDFDAKGQSSEPVREKITPPADSGAAERNRRRFEELRKKKRRNRQDS